MAETKYDVAMRRAEQAAELLDLAERTDPALVERYAEEVHDWQRVARDAQPQHGPGPFECQLIDPR